MSYLTHKKGFLIFLTILLVASGCFVFLSKEKPTQTYEKKQKVVAKVTAEKQIQEKDSDNDGLKDWEEVLWGTDPSNPDTDADGTKDGEEIKQSRNPLIKGFDDNLTIRPPEIPTIFEETESLTDEVAKQFALSFLTQKESLTETELTQRAEASLMPALEEIIQQDQNKIYTLSELTIVPTKDEEKIKEYANAIGAIIKKHFDPLPEDEGTVMARLLNQTDGQEKEQDAQKLGALAEAYKNTATEILNIETPEEFAEDHLTLINDFNQISESLKKMTQSTKDPVLGLMGIRNYLEPSNRAHEAMISINDRLLKNELTFSEEEPAQIFAVYTPCSEYNDENQ